MLRQGVNVKMSKIRIMAVTLKEHTCRERLKSQKEEGLALWCSDPRTQEAEAGRSGVQGQPGLPQRMGEKREAELVGNDVRCSSVANILSPCTGFLKTAVSGSENQQRLFKLLVGAEPGAVSPGGGAPSHRGLWLCAVWKPQKPFLAFQGLLMLLQNLPTIHWGNEEIGLLLAEAYRLKYMFADAPNHYRR